MFKLARKATSAVVAGAIALGTLALYPTGEKGKVNAAMKYDSASAVNFSTILGRAVDFGIVAKDFQQKSHMETTYAAYTFENVKKDANEVDFINNQTAQFIMAEVVGENPIIFGQQQTAAYYNFEGSSQVLEGFTGTTSGHFQMDYAFNTEGKSVFLWRENSQAGSNIEKIIDNVNTSRSVEISKRANSADYRLPASKMVVNQWNVFINIDADEFENKVVYVDVTQDMLSAMSRSDGLRINKRSSTIVVFNIDYEGEGAPAGITAKKSRDVITDNYESDSNGIHLNKMQVNVNNTEIHSTSGSQGGNYNDTHNTNKQVNDEICEKIIWNIMGPRTVELENTAGTFLISNEKSNVCVTGSCAGWVVSGGHFENNKEWHYIYTGGSQEAPTDLKGQMHFAIRKTFTSKYDSKDNIVEDKSIITSAGDYSFSFYKSNASYERLSKIGKSCKTQATNTVNLPTLQFYTNLADAEANNAADYYIPKGEENSKPFYFVIAEDNAGDTNTGASTDVDNPNPKIENSTGYINIKMLVTNTNNIITYKITSKTMVPDPSNPGQFITYASNNEQPMGGVRFDLGAFYNRIATPGYIKVTKSIVGDAEPTELTITIKDSKKEAIKSYVLGAGLVKNEQTGLYESEVLKVDDASAQYIVEESLYKINGYEVVNTYKVNAANSEEGAEATLDSVSTDPDNPTTVAYINTYTKILGKLNVSKTVDTTKAPGITVPASFSFYVMKDKDTYLKSDGSFTDDKTIATYTIGNNGTIAYTDVPAGTYTVAEVGGSVKGYTLNTTYENNEASIEKNGDEQTITIVNTYEKKVTTGSLEITKELATGAPAAASTKTYSFTVTGPDDYTKTVTVKGAGKVTISDLVPGSYTVTEDETGAKIAEYDLTVSGDNGEAKTVAAGETTSVLITNTYKKQAPTTGSLEITKELATGAPAAASTKTYSFTVTGPDDYTKTVTVKGAGKVTISDLVPGSYTVTEDETGAKIAEYDLTVSGDNGEAKTVAAGETTSVLITNTYKKQAPTTGSLEITKELATGAPAAASTKTYSFTVTGPDDYTKTVTVKGAGKVTISDLVPGSYTVTEDETGAKIAEYDLTVSGDNGEAKTVAAGETTSVLITNTYKKQAPTTGSLEITKELATGAPAAASEKLYTFTVTGPKNYTKTVTVKGGEKVTIADLEPGTYTVTEDEDDAAITNYTLEVSGDNKVAKTVTAGETTKVTITNKYTDNTTHTTGSLEITKALATGAPSAASEKLYTFTVTGPKNYTKTVTVKGGEKVTITDLEPGTYTVTEDEDDAAITNYTLEVSGDNKAAKTVTAGETTKVTITNKYTDNTTPTTGSLEITKALATGAPSAASNKVYSFTVTGPKNFEKTVTITGAGKVTLDNLEPGSYTVTEDETGIAIENYVCKVSGDNKVAKTVTAGQTTSVKITNTYTLKKGSLTITKSLGANAPSEANNKTFSFTISGPNNYRNVVNIKGAGTAKITDLTPGTYKVTEDVDGAKIDNYELEVSGDNGENITVAAGGSATCAITNTYTDNSTQTKGILTISKTLGTGAPSAASSKTFSFTVKGTKGYQKSVTIKGAGTVTLNDLDPDTYTVTEDETGAAIAEYDLTVTGDNKVGKEVKAGETTTVDITNTYKKQAAATGSLEITKALATGAPSAASEKLYTFTVTGPKNYTKTVTVKGGEKVTITDLEPGTYTVTEDEDDAAITNYTLEVSGDNKVAKTVTAGETTKVTITNKYTDNTTHTTGSLEITKALATGAPSAASEKLYTFTVTGPKNYTKTVTVKCGEKVTITDLEPGTYTVTEDEDDAAITNYTLEVSGDNKVAKTVTAGETTKVTITNKYTDNTTPTTGSLEITKALATGAPSAASEKLYTFTVTGPKNYTKTVTVKGGEKVTITDLEPGTYTVTEDEDDAAINNYTLEVSGDNKVAKTVTAGETTKVTITNKYTDNTTPTTGSLEITKALATGAPSAASNKVYSFTVTGPKNFEKTVTITGAGKVTLDNLEPGSYTVTEDETGAAIADYDLTVSGDNGKSKTVAAGETTKVEITNTYKKQSTDSDLEVTFEKKDEQNKLIANAELTLKSLDGYDMSNVYVMQNGKKITHKLSDDKTAITFATVDTAPSVVCGLKAGDYSLTETVTPKKYLTADAITFTLYADGTNNITVSGSPIVMIDRADPNYKPDDEDVISANRKPVPATGEEISFTSIIGVALICTCAVCLAGLGIYRIKRKRS